MNRQEAIKILKAAQTDKFPYDSGLLVEAMDMAISSLETDEAYQLEYEQPTITIPVEDYMNLLDAIPRERIEQMVAEILMKDFDRVTCGEDTLTPQDCVAIIRKYTKEQNND